MNYEDFKKLDTNAAIAAAASYVGVEPSVIEGLWQTESGRGQNKGPSRAGALGDFQLMPKTQLRLEAQAGRKFDANDFHDSLFMAAMHLKDDLAREKGDITAALRAYNNGPNWREKADPTGENAAYAAKVLGGKTYGPVQVQASALPEVTLDSTAPDPAQRMRREGDASRKLDQLLEAATGMPPRAVAGTGGSPAVDQGIAQADTQVRAADQLEADTGFLDLARAASVQRGITGAVLRRIAEEDYPPVPGFVLDPKELAGYSSDEQLELLEARSPDEASVIKARIGLRKEDNEVIGRKGFWIGLAAQLVAGLPEGVATGMALTKTIGLAGYGSVQLANEGRGAAAVASMIGENVVGNVAATGVEEVLGGRMSAEDYAMGATLGLAVSLPFAKSAIGRATEANLRMMEQRAIEQTLAKQQALLARASERLGPDASADALAAEVQRLEAEGIKQQINAAVGVVPEGRRLLPDDVNRALAGEELPEAAATDRSVGAPSPLGKTAPLPQENPAYFHTTGSPQVRTYLAGNDEDWIANIKDLTEGATLSEAQAMGPGVHVRPFLAGDAKLRPTVNAIRDLAAEFLPDSTIVLGLGKKSRLGKDVNGAVISAGKTHFIGMAPDSSPTNGLLTGVHEVGHAIFHEHFPDIPPELLARMVNEFQSFVIEARAGSAKARFRRFAEGSTNVTDDGETLKGALDLSNKKMAGYSLSFDEFTAEAFVRYIQRKVTGRTGGQKLVLDQGAVGLLKSLWNSIKGLYERAMSRGMLPKDEAFDEFFERVLTGTLKDKPLPKKLPKQAEEFLAPELIANFNREVQPQVDNAAVLATDPLAEKYGFNLMPSDTPQQRAEAKAVRALWEKATNPEADWNRADYRSKLSKLLADSPFDNTSSAMLRSENPVMRMISFELLENPAGAAGRRSTAALSKFITERAIMGNAINDLQAHYAAYRAAAGQSLVRDFTDGKLWQQFNRDVAAEVELRRMGGTSAAPDSVKSAADVLEGAYERSRLHQVNAKTIGWGSLPESSRGYMPHKLSPERVRNMTSGQKQALHAALADQFMSIEGFDPAFSANLASKYIDRVESRAVGDYGAPANVHQVGAAEVVEEALTAMGMSRDEVLAAMQRYMRGGASHTKARLKLDLLAEHDDGAGGTFRMLDLFETDQLRLLRSQAQRVSGEVALAQHGVMGKPGLSILRRAAQFGEDGKKATGKELEAFDQVAAEFLGSPFGTQLGKWGDRTMQLTSLSRLGGMGFTQFAEYINGVAALGVSRVMSGVSSMPRLISEARALARGEAVDNPILRSLEHEAAEFGTDSYKMVFPFDNPELQYQLYGADTVTFADRALRGATHLQGKLSFWRAIHSAQQRGMAEQIVLKAVKYLKEGSNDKALRDMGFTDELMGKLRKDLDSFVQFEGNRVKRLDITQLADRQAANEFIQAVHRGSAQIIQGTYIGETGKWAHSGWLKLLTQFRTFSITSVEKQWGRNVNNYGALGAVGILLGAMSVAAPIYIARVALASVGRADREEYLAERLSFEHLARASLNYVSMSGLAGDFLDAASAVSGVGKQTGGRTGNATEFVGNVVAPSAGLANDLWKALQNTKEGTDPHDLLKSLPFSKLPLVGIGINALGD